MSLYDQAVQAAHRFFARHQAEHLAADQHRLIDRCATHLGEALSLSCESALTLAAQAHAERESIGAQAYIDIDRCTSSLVTVRDTRTGAQHLIPLARLLALITSDTATARPVTLVQSLPDAIAE